MSNGSDPEDSLVTQPAETVTPGGTVRDDTCPFPEWGHLRLHRKIGEGGFGVVYHAHDLWLDQPVALKLLKTQGAQQDATVRILLEARKLARVRHPNVVSIHGADSHHGRVGFWMDLVEGHTLSDLVAGGRLSAGEASHIGVEVCRALAAVHQAKLVHRDVKAQNVMRAADGGRIILMDFGAGDFLDQPDGRRPGTPRYLAPELLAGAAATVRSDIYAVGVLLYYLVTSDYPVRASAIPDLRAAHERGQRQRLHDVRPDLPDGFVALVERALEPDPSQRYGSAGEMLAALSGESDRRDRERTVARPATHGLAQTAAAGASLGVAAGVLGLVSSRTFEVALRVDADFRAGLADYFITGAQALVPFVLVWAAGAAVVALLGSLWPFVRRRLGGFIVRHLPWQPDPGLVATAILLVGTVAAAWVTWAFFDVFAAIYRLFDAAATPLDRTILGPESRDLHRAHSQYSVALSFLLGLAAWRWLPRLEARSRDASTIRTFRWATIALACLVVALAVAPRRLLWERFEAAEFERRMALVIGRAGDELLLYSPDPYPERRWRVRQDSPALTRTGATRLIFDR